MIEIEARVVMLVPGAAPHAIIELRQDGQMVRHVRAGQEVLTSLLEDRDLDPDLLDAEIQQICNSLREFRRAEAQRVGAKFSLNVWRAS